MRKRIGDF
jgi:5'-AMP-activated protein kinase catalytic alpha subunit